MSVDALIESLDPEMESAEEETFLLFSQSIPSQNLGIISSTSPALEVTVAGRDLTIHQSPGLLSSRLAGGTTGAVLWKISPLFAEWIASPDNLLFKAGVLSSSSVVVELGCGVSPINALVLAPLISHYVLTDQHYVSKLVHENLAENTKSSSIVARGKASRPRPAGKAFSASHRNGGSATAAATGKIKFLDLDWETDTVTASFTGSREVKSFDMVMACDCIYNEALVEPFVQTCVDACKLRSDDLDGTTVVPCVCVVAQQLRDSDVFETWARAAQRYFHLWRVPSSHLSPKLRSNLGFVIHIGVLRGSPAEDNPS